VKHARSSRRLGRRQFLVEGGVVLAGLVSGCGRQRRETGRVSPASSPTAAPPTSLPTPTPPAATVASTSVPTVASTSVPTAAPVSLDGPADMAFINGKVITVNPSDAIVQAVTVKNGLIQAVGATEELRSRIDAHTEVVDLKGQAMTPGLIDSHCHLELAAMFNQYYTPLLPPEVNSIESLQRKLAELVARTPKGQWIIALYLTLGQGGIPAKRDLDPVSPEHPVWLMQQGGHFGTANSLALQMTNITSKTPSPSGGIIERDAAGELTGVFYNHRAMDLLRRYIPKYTLDQLREYIAWGQDLFASCGVTSFQDNNIRGMDNIGAYLDMGKQGKMSLRGTVYFTLEWPQDLDPALKEVPRYQDALMRFAGYKFLIDGQAPTAYCHQPHNGVSWNMPTWDPPTFKKTVRALHDTGLQICVHCAGDAAVDLVLDAYEEAMNANPRPDPRHRIEHAVFTTPEATRRMKDLGVVISAHPTFIRAGGDSWFTVFGEERVRRAIVTREWLDNGVHVALGSDSPTTPWHTPQMTLWAALARITVSGRVMGEEQRMTIQEALHSHTLGAAYAAHEEKIKGSIEVGKLADLTVWKEDPYAASVQRLAQAQIATTVVGGEVVYQG